MTSHPLERSTRKQGGEAERACDDESSELHGSSENSACMSAFLVPSLSETRSFSCRGRAEAVESGEEEQRGRTMMRARSCRGGSELSSFPPPFLIFSAGGWLPCQGADHEPAGMRMSGSQAQRSTFGSLPLARSRFATLLQASNGRVAFLSGAEGRRALGSLLQTNTLAAS